MKKCPQCHRTGDLMSHSAVRLMNVETQQLDPTAIQILDHVLKCPDHGLYEGNFKLNDNPEMPRVASPFEGQGDTYIPNSDELSV